MAGGAVGYLAVIPITTMIAKEGGLFQSVVATVAQGLPGLGNVQTDRIIPALSAFYIFATYIASSSASVAGQAAASDQGLDIKRKSAMDHTINKIYAHHFRVFRSSQTDVQSSRPSPPNAQRP